MTSAADPTLERILEAARREFEAGRSPSLADVAAAAGVSRATVHRRPGSRAELLRRLELEPDPDTERRVLEAAAEVVERTGLAHASMDEIAERAGVSRATVYRLHPGKAALLRALIHAFSPFDALRQTLAERRDRPPEVVVPELALAAWRSVGARPGMLRTVLTELSTAAAEVDAAVRDTLGRMLEEVGGYVAAQMAAGRLRPAPPLLALQALGGPILLHILTRPVAERLLGLDVDAEVAVRSLAEHWLRAMSPSPEETTP